MRIVRHGGIGAIQVTICLGNLFESLDLGESKSACFRWSRRVVLGG
jgi:hypothetical protein